MARLPRIKFPRLLNSSFFRVVLGTPVRRNKIRLMRTGSMYGLLQQYAETLLEARGTPLILGAHHGIRVS